MRRFSTRNISWAALVLSMLVLLSSNLNFASSQSSQISGCANKKTGALRISNKCTSSEKSITWSIQGPQGIEGVPGPQGLQGAQGIPGLQGTAGSVSSFSSSIIRSVYDSNGTLVGELYGAHNTSVTVKVGNSIVSYNTNGEITATGGIVYLDASCSGTKYSLVNFENEFSTLYPSIFQPEKFRNSEGELIYSPFELVPFVARVTGPVLSPTTFYYADYSVAGAWECVAFSPTPQSPRTIQAIQTFTPSFSLSIAAPFSIR